jgi:hypothetical protein
MMREYVLTRRHRAPKKLHHFWDWALDQGDLTADLTKVLSKALAVAPTLPDADATFALNLTTSAWFNESFADAKSKVYVSPIGEGYGPFVLTGIYRDAAKDEARERIALAGARFANILKESCTRSVTRPIPQEWHDAGDHLGSILGIGLGKSVSVRPNGWERRHPVCF